MEPNPVSVAGSDFTSSDPGAVLHVFPFFLLSSSIQYNHFVLYPVHWSISWPSTYWKCAGVFILQRPISHTILIVCLFSLLSSIHRPPLCFQVCHHKKKKRKKDPRCWRMSPEFIDGCTVLRNMGEI